MVAMNMKIDFASAGQKHRQQGVALVVGMVFLVAMSLTALIAMNRTILQERMTGAYRSEQIAYAAAESALRSGEWYLWNFPNVSNLTIPRIAVANQPGDCATVCASEGQYPDGVTTKLYSFKSLAAGTLQTTATFNGGAGATGGNGMIANADFLVTGVGSQAHQAPVVYMEGIRGPHDPESFTYGRSGLTGKMVMYRLTARGFGPTPDIERTLQTTFSLVR